MAKFGQQSGGGLFGGGGGALGGGGSALGGGGGLLGNGGRAGGITGRQGGNIGGGTGGGGGRLMTSQGTVGDQRPMTSNKAPSRAIVKSQEPNVAPLRCLYCLIFSRAFRKLC